MNIKYVCRLARHLQRDFRGSIQKYEWNEWEFSEFRDEKLLSWSFGHSKEDIRMSIDITLPVDWQKEDELRFARVLSALA